MTNNNKSIRSTINEIVSAIKPFDNIEQEHIAFVKTLIASGAEIFRTNNPEIHLVSYFVVIDQKTNQILLVDHKKAELWLPTGGHVEHNEHPKETVTREAKEELGIEAEFLCEAPLFLTVTNTVGNCPRHTDISLWYVLKGNSKVSLNYDTAEFNKIRWFNRQDIPFDQADPNMQRFVNKVIKKLITLNSYDIHALEYATNVEHLHHKEEIQRFLQEIPSQKANVIDIGCGSGRDVKIFSDLGADAIGIDFSSKMIEIARETAPSSSFYVMDIESLSFRRETFDGAWANCSLLHISKQNMPATLKKIYDILKPRGIFYVSVKQDDIDELFSPDARYEGAEKYWSFYKKDELIHLLNNAGFDIINVTISEKSAAYHTHPLIKVFAKKP